jgi:hypothetical protein
VVDELKKDQEDRKKNEQDAKIRRPEDGWDVFEKDGLGG